ncbi:DUF397 domain-containing protein [Streptomyces sp. NPDC059575]
MRDSKDPQHRMITFRAETWTQFIQVHRSGVLKPIR